MNSNERLKLAVDKLKSDNNYSLADIMRALNYAGGSNYLSDLMAGKKEISSRFLRRLEDKLFVRHKWIETGEGEMFIDSSLVLDQLIVNLFPEITNRHKKAVRTFLEIVAQIMCDATKKPYRQCLYDIYNKMSQAVNS